MRPIAAEMLGPFVTITLISCRSCRVTWLNTSAFALYLIPPALKTLLGKGSRDAPHHGACTASWRIIGFLTLESYRRATREWVREVDR